MEDLRICSKKHSRLDTNNDVQDGLLFLQIRLDDLLNLLCFWVLYMHSTSRSILENKYCLLLMVFSEIALQVNLFCK